MDTLPRCQLELGNHRYVRVVEWKGNLRVDIREWVENGPTKKGISIPLPRWKNFVDNIEIIDETLKNGTTCSIHLGGNVYCDVRENKCVDIRLFWKPRHVLVPTKKGIYLRPG